MSVAADLVAAVVEPQPPEVAGILRFLGQRRAVFSTSLLIPNLLVASGCLPVLTKLIVWFLWSAGIRPDRPAPARGRAVEIVFLHLLAVDPDLIPAVTGRFGETPAGGNDPWREPGKRRRFFSLSEPLPAARHRRCHNSPRDVEASEAFSQLVGFQVNPAEEIGHFRCGVNSLKLRELVGDPRSEAAFRRAGRRSRSRKVYAAGIEGTLFIDDASMSRTTFSGSEEKISPCRPSVVSPFKR